MKGLSFAVVGLVALFAVSEAQAFGGRTVVRRGVFGRTVVVQRGFVPHVNRGVVVDPHFRSFHGGNVVIDQFGRTVIIR